MRSFTLFVLHATFFVAQVSLAEQVTLGFAPACSNAACPHPVTAVYPRAPQQVGPRLFPPVLNSDTDAPPVPAPIRDFNVRVASNGVASDSKTERNALLQEKLSEVARLQQEIQQLRAELGQSQQILVKVKMMDVSLTKLRRLGVDISSASGGKFEVVDVASLRKAIESPNNANADQIQHSEGQDSPGAFVDWLIANCCGKVLAEPNLVVVSGRPAQFFCGSEIPLPGRDGANSAVEFRKCGTEVDVVAFSMNDNRVRLELRARVSQCTNFQSIRIDDQSIPALQVRQCDTAVETGFGQPVVLNGMIVTRVDTVKTNSGDKDEENEIALVLVVTPELVELPMSAEKPARATQTK